MGDQGYALCWLNESQCLPQQCRVQLLVQCFVGSYIDTSTSNVVLVRFVE